MPAVSPGCFDRPCSQRYLSTLSFVDGNLSMPGVFDIIFERCVMKRSAKLPLPGKQYTRDRRWIIRHASELTTEYPNKWVAVCKGRVVAVGEDSGSVERLARERTGSADIPVELMDDGTIIF